jgi:nitrous oxide reductase accessory protein NosL
MKNSFLLSILFLIVFSCTKTENEPINQPAKSTKEALARLAAVRLWKINKVTVNDKIVFENGAPTQPDSYDSLAEWMKFDISKNEIEVKYPYEEETSFFKFTINEAKQTFSVIEIGVNGEAGFEEAFSIKSGSVFTDKFEIEAHYDDEHHIYTLVPGK